MLTLGCHWLSRSILRQLQNRLIRTHTKIERPSAYSLHPFAPSLQTKKYDTQGYASIGKHAILFAPLKNFQRFLLGGWLDFVQRTPNREVLVFPIRTTGGSSLGWGGYDPLNDQLNTWITIPELNGSIIGSVHQCKLKRIRDYTLTNSEQLFCVG